MILIILSTCLIQFLSNMKALLIWISVIALSFICAMFDGWLLYEVYELAIVPFVDLFYIDLPRIYWLLFVLIPISYGIIFYKQPKEKYSVTDKVYWAKLLSQVFSKLYLLGMLYIMNLICF